MSHQAQRATQPTERPIALVSPSSEREPLFARLAAALGGQLVEARSPDELRRWLDANECVVLVVDESFSVERESVRSVLEALEDRPTVLALSERAPEVLRQRDPWTFEGRTPDNELAIRLLAASIERKILSLRAISVHDSQTRVRMSLKDMLLDEALERCTLAFQPVVSIRERRAVAYEALLRSAHPKLTGPLAVLDAAFELGRIRDVGARVRQLVCDSTAHAPPDVDLFVNVHASELEDDSLIETADNLHEFSKRVVLEITEQASLASIPDISAKISRLRKLGYRIAVDDLGAGYAALSVLALIEPEVVKVDMSLVRAVDASAVKRRVIRSILTLAQDVGASVVCEGVETEGEYRALEEIGCDLLQGYYLAKPAAGFTVPLGFDGRS
ncbi:MAG: EAL domain-containing protein [Myxococcales bacterium]|nr:EAL domain-containing protein [Myxococcales bacterium]